MRHIGIIATGNYFGIAALIGFAFLGLLLALWVVVFHRYASSIIINRTLSGVVLGIALCLRVRRARRLCPTNRSTPLHDTLEAASFLPDDLFESAPVILSRSQRCLLLCPAV